MSVVAEPKRELIEFVNDMLMSVRYLTDVTGSKTDVVLSLSAWKSVLNLLEELDDRLIVKEWLPRLQAGPVASGALRWEEVSDEWEDNDETI